MPFDIKTTVEVSLHLQNHMKNNDIKFMHTKECADILANANILNDHVSQELGFNFSQLLRVGIKQKKYLITGAYQEAPTKEWFIYAEDEFPKKLKDHMIKNRGVKYIDFNNLIFFDEEDRNINKVLFKTDIFYNRNLANHKLYSLIGKSDVTNTEFLKKSGFKNLGKLSKVFNNGLPKIEDLEEYGLYAVTKKEDYEVDYIKENKVVEFENVLRPWNMNALKSKWVNNADVLYYGFADKDSKKSLRRKVGNFINHAVGKTSDRGPHKSGEILWQLKGYENFNLWINAVKEPPKSKFLERTVLLRFVDLKGKLPFGNTQIVDI